jgi:hypothetical protein
VYQRATVAAGEEQAIAAESPYWMKTQLIAERVPSPAPIPLTDGYIEVELPPHFLRNQERAFTIEWIDFYR